MLVSYALAVVQEGPEATAVEVIQDGQQEMLVKLEGRRKLRDESYNSKTESVIWDCVFLTLVNIQLTFSSVPVSLLACFLLSFVKCIKSNSILSIFEPNQSSSEWGSVCLNQEVAGWCEQLDWEELTVWWKWNPERSSQTASGLSRRAKELNVGETTNLDSSTFTIIISNVCFMFL